MASSENLSKKNLKLAFKKKFFILRYVRRVNVVE
jgi:hypothetical protein